jgi:hypothetical protein
MAIEVTYASDHPTKANVVEYFAPGCQILGSLGPYAKIFVTPTIVPDRKIRLPLSGTLDASSGTTTTVTFTRAATANNRQLANDTQAARAYVGRSMTLSVNPVSPTAVTITDVSANGNTVTCTFTPALGSAASATTEAVIDDVQVYTIAGAWREEGWVQTAQLLCDGPTGHEFYVENLDVRGPANVQIWSDRDASGPPWDAPKWFRFHEIYVEGADAQVMISAERVRGHTTIFRRGGILNFSHNDAIYEWDGRLDRKQTFPGALLQGAYSGRVDAEGYLHFICQASYISFLGVQATAGATSLTLSGFDALLFPSGGGTILLSPNRSNEETITYTSRSGSVLTLSAPIANTHVIGRRVCYPRSDANSAAMCAESGWFEFFLEGIGHVPSVSPTIPAKGLLTTTADTGQHAHAAFANGGDYVGMLIEGVTGSSPVIGLNIYGGGRGRIGGGDETGHVKGVNLNCDWDGTNGPFSKTPWLLLGSGVTVEFQIHAETDPNAYIARASLGSGFFFGANQQAWQPTWKFYGEPGCYIAHADGDGSVPLSGSPDTPTPLRLIVGPDGEVRAQGEIAGKAGVAYWNPQSG